MSDEYGKNRPSDNAISALILHERLAELKEQYRLKETRDMELFQQLSDNQRMLSERLLVVETNGEHISNAVIKLSKETSLQTKLLSGILLSLIGAVVTVIIKATFHI
jgi:hypothetical protein